MTRVFANAASLGLVPVANRIAHRIRRTLPGKLCYRLGGLAAVLGGSAEHYLVRSEGAAIHDGPALSLTFANGETFGAGLRIAPGVSASDGTLDLVAIGALGLPRTLLALARAERGRHAGMRGVTITPLRGSATVEGPPGEFLLEADGQEYPARGVVTVDLLPGALTLFG
jgi:diacylglycerol kinase (ATP)